MEGAALRQRHELDIATYTAWHTAIFGLNGYAGKLKGKSLADFLSGDRPSAEANKYAQAIAWAHRMQAKGVPMIITRNEIN